MNDQGEQKSLFERNPKKTFFLFFVFLFLLLSVITVIVIEVFFPKPQLYITHDKIVMRQHKPNETYPNEESPTFRTDNNGFIEPAFVYDSSDCDIFFMGGSTTLCIGVPEAKRFAYLSAKIISEELGLAVNGINAAYSGNHSMHNKNILENKILNYHPDYVVLFNNINDLVQLYYTKSYWARSQRELVQDIPPFKIFKNLLREVFSSTYQTIKVLIRSHSAIDEWKDYRDQVHTIDSTLFLQYKNSLTSFVNSVKIWNSKPVLMTQPYSRLENELNFNMQLESLQDSFNIIIRQVAEENKIPVIDLDYEIPESKEYLPDGLHFNEKASILAAKIISGFFIKEFSEDITADSDNSKILQNTEKKF